MRKPVKTPSRRRQFANSMPPAANSGRSWSFVGVAAACLFGLAAASAVALSLGGSWEQRVRAAYQRVKERDAAPIDPARRREAARKIPVDDLAIAIQVAARDGKRMEIVRLVRSSPATQSREYSLLLMNTLRDFAARSPLDSAASAFAAEVVLTELVRTGRVVRQVVDVAEQIFRQSPDFDVEHARAAAQTAELLRRRQGAAGWTVDPPFNPERPAEENQEAPPRTLRGPGNWTAARSEAASSRSGGVLRGELIWGGGAVAPRPTDESVAEPDALEEPPVDRPATRTPAEPMQQLVAGGTTVGPSDQERSLLRSLYTPSERWQAFEALQAAGWSEAAIEVGRRAVSDDWQVRRQLVEILPQIDEVDAGSWLMLLSRDPSAEVRRRVVALLAASNSPDLLARLAELAALDPDPQIRATAARISGGSSIR